MREAKRMEDALGFEDLGGEARLEDLRNRLERPARLAAQLDDLRARALELRLVLLTFQRPLLVRLREALPPCIAHQCPAPLDADPEPDFARTGGDMHGVARVGVISCCTIAPQRTRWA